jgi:hypothetical protein
VVFTFGGNEHVEESMSDLDDLKTELEISPGQIIRPLRGRIIRPLKAEAAKDTKGDGFSTWPPNEENVWPPPGDFARVDTRGADGFSIRPPDEENFRPSIGDFASCAVGELKGIFPHNKKNIPMIGPDYPAWALKKLTRKIRGGRANLSRIIDPPPPMQQCKRT